MEITNQLWSMLEGAAGPDILEINELDLVEPTADTLLYRSGSVTEQYLQVQLLYRFLFSMYVLGQSGLEKLDNKLAEQSFPAALPEDMDFYQRYDLLGLRYFYLRSFAHVERLSTGQVQSFLNCWEQRDNEQALQAAGQIMEKTCKRVMAVAPDKPQQQFELYPSIYGSGLVPGAAVVIGLRSTAAYDEQGMLVNNEADQRRINVFYNLKTQLEKALSDVLALEVKVMVEV